MDATGSMSSLIEKTKSKIGAMFQNVNLILLEKGIDPNCVQIQFVAYRNYSSQERILQPSAWSSNPDGLRAFLNGVKPEGGQGNEAIEIGLLHCNQENEKKPISQVILIGDAPPNTREDVQLKIQGFPQNFYRKTYYKDEYQILSKNKIPVHCFYVINENRVKEAFEEISRATGGRFGWLDINSPNGEKILVDIFSEMILRDVGKSYGLGDSLVENYKKKFN